MMSYDNYHNTTKVTTDPDPEYELVGDAIKSTSRSTNLRPSGPILTMRIFRAPSPLSRAGCRNKASLSGLHRRAGIA